jgi:hypothetical protein
MKYYLMLLFWIFFMFSQIGLTFILWNSMEDLKMNVFFVSLLLFSVYTVYRMLIMYSKYSRVENNLTVNNVFSKECFDLSLITSWHVFNGTYGISLYRQLDFYLNGKKITLTNISDYKAFEELVHYLRIEYSELRI